MDDFAEWCVDKLGGFGEFFIVGVRVGNPSFVGGVKNLDDSLLYNSLAFAVGIFRTHAGKVKNCGAPGNNDGSDNADGDEFFLVHMLYVS